MYNNYNKIHNNITQLWVFDKQKHNRQKNTMNLWVSACVHIYLNVYYTLNNLYFLKEQLKAVFQF